MESYVIETLTESLLHVGFLFVFILTLQREKKSKRRKLRPAPPILRFSGCAAAASAVVHVSELYLLSAAGSRTDLRKTPERIDELGRVKRRKWSVLISC
jgi:hypothetical protein